MKKILFFLVLIPLLFFSSCERENIVSEQDIVGTWYIYITHSQSDTVTYSHSGTKILVPHVFKKSGTGRFEISNFPFVDFAYSVIDSELKITVPSRKDLQNIIHLAFDGMDSDGESMYRFEIVSLTKSKMVLKSYDYYEDYKYYYDDEDFFEDDYIVVLYRTEKEAKANPIIRE